jgi:predicted ATP-dependent serine protease
VDVVLYLEGESFNSYRILRSAKNRFGSTNEVGVFEMCGTGLMEVSNPSQLFLESYVNGAIGAAVVPTLEGSRPLLVEIQALTSMAAYGPPRRISNGVDFNRLLLISAVLTRRAGVGLYNQDVIVNVTGGIKIAEPAADLALAEQQAGAEVLFACALPPGPHPGDVASRATEKGIARVARHGLPAQSRDSHTASCCAPCSGPSRISCRAATW